MTKRICIPKPTRTVRRATLVIAMMVAMATAVTADDTSGTLNITVGHTIDRTYSDVQSDNYAYAPKQEVDRKTKETHVWLPYGSKGIYLELSGARVTDPGPGTGTPLVESTEGGTSARMVFKLHFDKPISAFRFFAGWSEWGLGGGTVGGIEYSTDEKKWTTIREVSAGKIIEPFTDSAHSFSGLNTQDLYIRCYSRDKNDPTADSGTGSRWMKFRMGGDPAWGDAPMTFFHSQMQIWVTPAPDPSE